MDEIGYEALDSRLLKQYRKAEEVMLAGDERYAKVVLSQLLKREPRCYDARRLLLLILGKEGGRRTFGRRLRGIIFVGIEGKCMVRREPVKRIQACEAFLEKWGLRPEVLELMGAVAMEMNWNRTAVTIFRAWLEGEDTSTKAKLRLAQSLERSGENEEAIRVVQRLLEREPGNAEAQGMFKRLSVRESLKSGGW